MATVPTTDRPPFTCPTCGATSWHPVDVDEGYCGRCHDWTRLTELGELARAVQAGDTLASDGLLGFPQGVCALVDRDLPAGTRVGQDRFGRVRPLADPPPESWGATEG